MESDNSIKVSNESLLKLKKNKNISTASYETIFDVKEGNLVCLMLNINEDIKEKIIEKTKNLLSFSSLLSLIKKENKSASEKTDEENSFYLNDKDILNPIAFFSNLFFFFHKEDEARRNTDNYHLKLNIVKELRDSFIFPDNVKKSLISEYETHLKNLCSFLKIFKKEILKITYEKEEDSDYYRCNKYIVYKNYRIEPTYESAGIKKLIHLYNALKRAIDGKIVLIDELDTHINTIYLNKFLLFFKQYGEGQLIFTSHNLEPMDVLETQVPTSTKPLKYSIDFIDDNQNLVPWVKNGHYHAHSQYYDGAIKGSPFNIEPDDFASCFFSKKTEKGRD